MNVVRHRSLKLPALHTYVTPASAPFPPPRLGTSYVLSNATPYHFEPLLKYIYSFPRRPHRHLRKNPRFPPSTTSRERRDSNNPPHAWWAITSPPGWLWSNSHPSLVRESMRI